MSEKNPTKVRKHIFVDHKVQGALLLRVLLYWTFWAISIALLLLCWHIVTGPARPFHTHFNAMWFHYGPALLASFLLLPMVMVDLVRLSNRFTGPLVRLRRSMRALARGERVEAIQFRDSDFWQEFAEEFNAVLAEVEKHRANSRREHDADEESEPAAVGSGS